MRTKKIVFYVCFFICLLIIDVSDIGTPMTKTVASVMFYGYLLLWAINTLIGYRSFVVADFFDQIEPSLRNRAKAIFLIGTASLLVAMALPFTEIWLWSIWHRFFPTKPVKFDDVKPTE